VVSSLIDEHPTRFAVVEYHTQFDGYDLPWGQDRLDLFYGVWCGTTIPVMMYDGFYFWDPEDYPRGLSERLGVSTDVTIELAASEQQERIWDVSATVCIESGGADKRMRIYAVQTLDHFPSQPSYSRRTFKQAAPTRDVDLDAGGCAEVSFNFSFDDESWVSRDDIAIVSWAQETTNYGPALVFQAAEMEWPFPQAGGPLEPELPRQLRLSPPIFDDPASAWLEDARPASVIGDSAGQVQATYQALCGDTSGLYPIGDPPSSDGPFPRVAYDHGSVPIFAAGSGQQEVLLCDYEGFGHYPNTKWNVPTEGGPVEVPSCGGQVRPSGPIGLESEGYLVLYDDATSTSYDFWQATTVRDGECQSHGAGLPGPAILQAGQADFFAIGGSGANPAGARSARPSGTPLLAGAILPEDVESGEIAHALAVAIPGLRNTAPNSANPIAADVFYPASTTDTERYSINPGALAAGQRLRLRTGLVDAAGEAVNEQSLAPITRMVLRAARRYGAYAVDTADGFTFFAEDIHTAVLGLDDGEVNALIGEPAGSDLPTDKTRWQIVIEKLNQELAGIPFAAGPCDGPSSVVETANWVVVQPATPPQQTLPAPRRVTRRMQAEAP
jgi:hypothetical protein